MHDRQVLVHHMLSSPMQGNGSFHIYARCTLPSWAVMHAGAPDEVWLDIRSEEDSEMLQYDVIWVNKTPTRLPEARDFVPLQSRHCVAPMVGCAGQEAQQKSGSFYHLESVALSQSRNTSALLAHARDRQPV